MRSFGPLLVHFLPTAATLRGLGQAIWVLVQGGWRALLWGDVAEGMVNIRTAPPSVRTLARTAFLLTLGLLVSLLFNDLWRASSSLVPVAFVSSSSAPPMAPRALIPITLGLIALAWAYMLTGALHGPWPLRVGFLVIYGADVFLWLALGEINGMGLLLLLMQLAALVALVPIFLLRWRKPPWPALEFPLILACVGTTAIAGYLRNWMLEQSLSSAVSWTAGLVTAQSEFVRVFLLPFFLIAGMEVAGVALDLSGLVGGTLRRLGWPLRVVALLLALGLGLRLWSHWAGPLLAGDDLPMAPAAWLILALLAALAYLVRPRLAREDLPPWAPVASAFLLFGLVLVTSTGLGLVGGALLWFINLGGSTTASDAGMAVIEGVSSTITRYNEAFAGTVALLWGLWVVWRASRRSAGKGIVVPPLALYAWMFGLWLIWWRLTRPGQVLGLWRFDTSHIDAALTLAVAVLLLALWAAGRLTGPRLWWLVAAALLAVFLRVQDFLSDPLSPLFGLLGAQALLISVGVFLGLMAAGKRFQLNEDSRAAPRAHRIMIYFGYVLFSMAVTNWLWASRQTALLDLADQSTQGGFHVIGLPFVLLVLLAGSLVPDLMAEGS